MQLIVAVDWKAMKQGASMCLISSIWQGCTLTFFYQFHHKRHQRVTAIDPKPCKESLSKAKLCLDKVPKDFFGDTCASWLL